MPDISIYAHRGGLLNAPENTVAAFKAAFAAGADAIECDIRRTADGEFIACHDRTLKRITGHAWPVAETAWGHLKTLRVFGAEPIAHLDDILNLMILRPGREFFFEMALKKESDAADLARHIARAGVQRSANLLAFSTDSSFLKAAGEAVPDIGLAVMPLFPSDVVGTARRAGAHKVCAGWIDWPLTKELFYAGASAFGLKEQLAAAAAAGIEVSAGVANDPRDIRRLRELGLKAIWTDDVPMALKYI
ncbi:MAG TPA: glycerophosphodiester phosphodiesterase family protein [Elusimicrobiales bacterium]|nr:glycerophosphodiester phosphodiesterase family protein [Elusimicrobiales bacterium]